MARCSEEGCSRTGQHKCGKCGAALCWEHYVPAPEHGGALCLLCAFDTPGHLAGMAARVAAAAAPEQGDPETEGEPEEGAE